MWTEEEREEKKSEMELCMGCKRIFEKQFEYKVHTSCVFGRLIGLLLVTNNAWLEMRV